MLQKTLKRSVINFLHFFIVLLITFSCSKGNDSTNSSSPDEVSAVVSASGGIVEVTDPNNPIAGTSVEIPEGAIDATAVITITKNDDPNPPEEDMLVVGNTISLITDVPVFNEDVIVTIPYNDKNNDSILDGTDVPETDIVVTQYLPEFKRWLRKPILNQDVIKKTVTFKTDHFCDWQCSAVKRSPSDETKDVIFTIDGLDFMKTLIFINDSTPRVAYLSHALINELNLDENDFSIKSYKGPVPVDSLKVQLWIDTIQLLSLQYNFYEAYEDSFYFLNWYANDQNVSWDGNANHTYNILEDLIATVGQEYRFAKRYGNRFILIGHSWGTVLTELSLLYAKEMKENKESNDPIKPDLVITLSAPRGSEKVICNGDFSFIDNYQEIMNNVIENLNKGSLLSPFNVLIGATEQEIINALSELKVDQFEYIVANYSGFWINYCKNRMHLKGEDTNTPQFLKWNNYFTLGDVISGPIREIVDNDVNDICLTGSENIRRNAENTVNFHKVTSLDYEPGSSYLYWSDYVRARVKEDILGNSAPSKPENLIATAISSSQINLSWDASTDNVGVAGYHVYRDNVFLKDVTTNSTVDGGLASEREYCYAVSAYDASNNESKKSDQSCVSTLSGGSWSIETVDINKAGQISSIAVDNAGNPHISYQDWTNIDLKYAKWTGTNWSITTVDSVGHLSRCSSIAIDNNDRPHISYYDYTNSALKYAKWTGSNWEKTTVDNSSDVGWWNSIAVDGDNNPHICYIDTDNHNLKYAKWTGSNWLIEIVDSEEGVGWNPSIAIDNVGNVHISYDGGGNVKYAKRENSSWLISTIGSGSDSSIAVDDYGKPHVCYGSNYAKWTGSSWSIVTIDSMFYDYTSIALDNSANPHFICRGISNGYRIIYAKLIGSYWMTDIIDANESVVSSFPSIAVDRFGYVHVCYQDTTNYLLKYAKYYP